MKKLFIILAAVTLTAMSANVFAQSTGTTPAPGATHSYFITPGDAGNTITWSVTKGDLTTDAGTDVTISNASAATTDITWAEGLSTDAWYYVHVLEIDANDCSNEKVLPVQITASPFYLTLAAANAEQCYDGAVSISIDGSDPSLINYDHGTATIEFTVTPTGLSSSYDGYSFDLSLTVPTGYNAIPAFSANASIEAGGTVTVTDNNAVIITYTVDNTNVYNNTTDPDGDAADFVATANISNGVAVNGVSDSTEGTYEDETSVSRPHTSGIGTN
jgi:hypothetical protein